VKTGRWGGVATPWALQAAATGLELGDAAFVPYDPPPLSGDNGRLAPDR
jgi:hypothetical protein